MDHGATCADPQCCTELAASSGRGKENSSYERVQGSSRLSSDSHRVLTAPSSNVLADCPPRITRRTARRMTIAATGIAIESRTVDVIESPAGGIPMLWNCKYGRELVEFQARRPMSLLLSRMLPQ